MSIIAADDDDDDDDDEDDDDDIFGAGGGWFIDVSGWLHCESCDALSLFAAFLVSRSRLTASKSLDCLRSLSRFALNAFWAFLVGRFDIF